MLGMMLAGSVAACAYGGSGDPLPTAAGQSHRPAPSVPSKGPEILSTETRNYAELERRLSAALGSVVLADAGPADGPGVGFRKAATVMTAGPHTVTAACVGARHAQISLSQETKGGTEHMVFEVDCSEARSQVVQLQKGYVSARLTRHDPTGAWTGAVAGIRITVQ